MLRCPKCGSIRIHAVIGGYAGWIYRCKECGYEGAFVIDYDEDSENAEHTESTVEQNHD